MRLIRTVPVDRPLITESHGRGVKSCALGVLAENYLRPRDLHTLPHTSCSLDMFRPLLQQNITGKALSVAEVRDGKHSSYIFNVCLA